MTTVILINIGLCNGLLPDGTKPLPEPMLSSIRYWHIHLMAIITGNTEDIIHENMFENYPQTELHLPGNNELNVNEYSCY